MGVWGCEDGVYKYNRKNIVLNRNISKTVIYIAYTDIIQNQVYVMMKIVLLCRFIIVI